MPLIAFKVCPACDEHNPPARLECKNCETDLTGIKVVNEASLQTANNAPANAESSGDGDAQGLVKICDCGITNPPQARKCSSCGEDISDIQATSVQPDRAGMKSLLRAIGDTYTFALEKAVTIIGREADMREYLSIKAYVSRNHAKFTVVNSDVYIENMSGTNHTFVNNILIPSDAPTLLKNGDEIGIGGKLIDGKRQNEAAYFVIEVTK